MEIADIKGQLSMAQVLQYYHLKPDKSLRLHCPFHEDKTPSLQVYYKTQTAYCFSSNCKTHGKSLDVIDFVMYQEQTDKHQALLKCTEIIYYYTGKVHHQQHQQQPAATIPAATLTMSREQFLGNMFTYFKNAVVSSKPAREYLQGRGLDPLQLEVGYNTAQFHHGNRKDDALIGNCVAVGLLAPWGTNTREGGQAYKPFGKYCIVFALRSPAGAVSGLYFRSTVNDDNSKHYYLKDSTGLYPAYPHPGTTRLIIAESIIDTASLLQIKTITDQYSLLAAYGTNRLTAEIKAAITGLQQLQEIIFAFDNDEAGHKAAAKYQEELQSLLPHITISKIILPCKDVNETLQTHSDTAIFTELLNERTTNFSFCQPSFLFSNGAGDASHSIEEKEQAKLFIETPLLTTPTDEPASPAAPSPQPPAAAALDTTHPYKLVYKGTVATYYIQGGLPKGADSMKIMLVVEDAATGRKARNRVDLYEDKQVEKLTGDIIEKLPLRRDELEADLYRLTDLLDGYRDALQTQAAQNDTTQAYILTAKERQEAEAFARAPKLLKRLGELLGHSGIVGEERNRLFLLLIAISHKMPETLHALIQGSSGSGKTRLLKQVTDCIPKEQVTKLTRLSDKVLYNYPEHYFVNRLLCLEDIDGLSEEAEFAFRELQSNGELNSATSIKLESGQITSGQKTVKGPIASLACTTRGEIYEDNMSRVFLIAVDESAAQTGRIIEYQNRLAAGVIDKEQEDKTKHQVRNFVQILEPRKVINPYATQLQLPPQAHKIRRLNDLFQGFVKMVTIVHQYQRQRDERGRLIARLEDVESAVAIMFESIVLKVDELDGSLRQFYEQLKHYLQTQHKHNYQQASFTLREIRHALKISKTQAFRYATDLLQLEYIRQHGGHANKGFTYTISYWDNYQVLRQKIKQQLDEQIKALKQGTPRNTTGTLEPAPVL